MIEKYAAIISALSAFISTGIVIWVSCFRKTRRDRIDELKTEMQVLFTGEAVKELSKILIHLMNSLNFLSLNSKENDIKTYTSVHKQGLVKAL